MGFLQKIRNILKGNIRQKEIRAQAMNQMKITKGWYFFFTPKLTLVVGALSVFHSDGLKFEPTVISISLFVQIVASEFLTNQICTGRENTQ